MFLDGPFFFSIIKTFDSGIVICSWIEVVLSSTKQSFSIHIWFVKGMSNKEISMPLLVSFAGEVLNRDISSLKDHKKILLMSAPKRVQKVLKLPLYLCIVYSLR